VSEAAAHWDALADKEDRWAALLESGTAVGTPERPEPYRKEARRYRNVAQSIRLTDTTGVTHCACAYPPHALGSR
jgi:hypothetical protein